MPIYEYICTNDACAHQLEALQKMSDDRLVFCPSCGEASLKKKISAAGFRLKGSGWYETDFKNSGKKTEAPKSKDSSASEKSAGGSTDKSGAKSGGGSTEAA